jgi:CrcB protein
MSSGIGAVHWAAVAGGSAIGAMARWAAGLAFNALWAGFPLGTLMVNCIGGALIGMAMVWFQQSSHETMRLFLVTGVLGGFTTFSSFSAESLGLLQQGEWPMALVHTLAHVLGALACTALGFALMRAVLE